MLKLAIDAQLPEHPLYGYMRSGQPRRFRWATLADADAVVLALENPQSQERIAVLLKTGRRFFLYFESTFWLTKYCMPEFLGELRRSPLLLGVVSHARRTLGEVGLLFQCKKEHIPLPEVKTFHMPIGVPKQSACHKEYRPPLRLLFWGSHDVKENTWVDRGGEMVDRLVCRLMEEIPCNLTLRAPANVELECQRRFHRQVIRFEERVTREQLDELHRGNDVLLLPSSKAHFVSVPYAMSFGVPTVGLHHWALHELVTDGVDGILATDEEELFQRCLKLPEQLACLSLGALATQLRNHDAARYAERWDRVIERAIPEGTA